MGRLFLVSTPIGNLQDISLRALEVLRTVDAIACEDTRVTKKLCAAHEISTPLIAHHAHSGEGVRARLVERIARGQDIALVSDAGTPLLSDPGAELVQDVLQTGGEVIPIPGASAALAALVASGLCPQPFVFVGFLPRKSGERAAALAPYEGLPATLVIYEAPGRVLKLLEQLQIRMGDRPAVVARELTKRFESYLRGSLSELIAAVESTPPRGEVVVLVGPPTEDVAPAGDIDADIRRLLAQGLRASDVAKTVAGAYGLSKKEVYRRVLAASEEG